MRGFGDYLRRNLRPALEVALEAWPPAAGGATAVSARELDRLAFIIGAGGSGGGVGAGSRAAAAADPGAWGGGRGGRGGGGSGVVVWLVAWWVGAEWRGRRRLTAHGACWHAGLSQARAYARAA